MSGDFYLGGHRTAPRGRKKSRWRLWRFFLILLCIFLMVSLWLNYALLPQLRALCATSIGNRLQKDAEGQIYTLLEEEGCTYEDFIHLRYGANGEVRSASVDTVRLNRLQTKLAVALLSFLSERDIIVSVPIGNLQGLLLFSGVGGDLTLHARVTEGLRTHLDTVFTEAGINQTRHSIGFSFTLQATYLLARKAEKTQITLSIPIGETVIVGEVPDSLTQINRFTDEITETDIDDVVDFGDAVH